MVEQRVELSGLGPQAADAGQIALVARQRRHATQACVCGLVIDLLEPGPQPGIEVGQIGDAPLVELAEELIAARPMPALQLAFALGRVGPAEDEVDAQARTDALQGVGPVGRAVVDNQLDGHAPAQQRLLEHALDIERRLAQTKRAVGHQPRRIVDQRDEVGLAQRPFDGHTRAMHHVAVPDRSGELGGEAALFLGQVCRAANLR